MMNRVGLKQTLIALFAGMIVAGPTQVRAESGSDQTLREAERMIARCLDYAAGQKLTPLSVGVIDASGALVAFKRQDGASIASAEAALLKARTALRLNAPTAVLAQAAVEDATARDAFLVMQMTTLPGGVPLADGAGRAVGAVGVSGATADQDTECARRAVDPTPAKRR